MKNTKGITIRPIRNMAGEQMFNEVFFEDAEAIARRGLEIAAGICVYTNTNVTVESLEASG